MTGPLSEPLLLDSIAVQGRTDLLPSGEGRSAAEVALAEALRGWLTRSPSLDTRTNYARDLAQFVAHLGAERLDVAAVAAVRPHHIAAWRDALAARGLSTSSIRRKLTVLRSLFSYLRSYGLVGANPAHSDFVAAPPAPRDDKTPGLTPAECRALLDSPSPDSPRGVRDRALVAVLAYTGIRVGELARLRVGDWRQSSGHHVLGVRGKGGRERRVPLHAEGVERLTAWVTLAGLADQPARGLFPPLLSARAEGRDGFADGGLTRRAVQRLVKGYARRLGLDAKVSVHSLRVTALTTARERGSDLVDLQDFAGHSDPRTTLGYIRSRDRLSRSPAYVLRY